MDDLWILTEKVQEARRRISSPGQRFSGEGGEVGTFRDAAGAKLTDRCRSFREADRLRVVNDTDPSSHRAAAKPVDAGRPKRPTCRAGSMTLIPYLHSFCYPLVMGPGSAATTLQVASKGIWCQAIGTSRRAPRD